MSELNVVCVLTARMASERLPGKPLAQYWGRTNLDWMLDRLRAVKSFSEVIAATSTDPSDDPIAEWGEAKEIRCFRGSPNNVTQRIKRALDSFSPGCDYVFRGMCDMPFVDPNLVDMACDVVSACGADAGRLFSAADRVPVYGAAEFPYKASVVARLDALSSGSSAEHFGSYVDLHREDFDIIYPCPPEGFDSLFYRPYRLELDAPEDLELVRAVYDHFRPRPGEVLPLREVILFLDSHPEIAGLNAHVPEKTGPLTSYPPELRRKWALDMEKRSVDWRGDWLWLKGFGGLGQALWCENCGYYFGYAIRGPDKVHRLHLPDEMTTIEGRAELYCPRCGEVRVWRIDRKAWR